MQRELEEIEGEIERISRALSQTADDDPNRPLLLARLGSSHRKRFELRGEPEDINKAIEYTSITLTMSPDDDPGFPGLLTQLGWLHDERYKRLNDLDDSNKSVEYTSRALSLTSEGHPELPDRLGDLGSFHGTRFQSLGVLEDLEKSIEYISGALSLIPQGHPDLPHRLNHLGVSYILRFEHLGDVGDIEKSIEYESQAVASTPNGDANLPNRLDSLAASHCVRFNSLGELGDLEKAIEYQSRALASTPDGHPDLSALLANLGVFHNSRFESLGDLGDLEKATEYQSRALALTPDSHPDLSSRLANLGVSHGYRFQCLGEQADLERAIECESRALALTPDGHPHLPVRLSNLAVSHRIRFERMGDLGNLEKAIEFQSRAVALTPDEHSYLPSLLQNLGVSHRNRFERLGELGDLVKAIKYETRALELTPDGHPDLSNRLANLGVSHKERFLHLGEPGDLEKAIEYGSRAAALTPDGHPDFLSQLDNLAEFHSQRFRHLGDPDDIEKAIEHRSRVVSSTPDDHPDLPNRIYNLGVSHAYRFEQLDKQQDLDKVIECMSRAIALAPDGHPTLLDKHYSLARYRLLHYYNTNNPSDLQDSFHSIRMASQSLAGSPRNRFKYASIWADMASIDRTLNPMEAYKTAINTLPQFIWLGATTNQRYQDLEQVQNLATGAAVAAILASEYKLALEWLEHARCVVWNQNLMLRSPLDQLHASHPSLATHLQTVANQLHHAGSESRESQLLSSGLLISEQEAQQHRRLAKEYEDLVSQARMQPGFEDFLQPVKANRLVQAARYGPIVVINCHDNRCDALAILPGQDTIDHIFLPNFTGAKAQRMRIEMERSVRARQLRERGAERRPLLEQEHDSASDFAKALGALWHDIAKPVLEFLGYMNTVSTQDLPHITWCPTGALSFLPLHAAGDYEHPNSRIFNYVISSYTPTLTALLTPTSHSLTSDSQILAIGQANTPGHSALPGTTAELELVKAHIQEKAKYSQLVDHQATTAAVLDSMEKHDWVHLACHAHQNVQDPTKSGFFLHDDTLDLAAINRRSFNNKGLAYLSACQTATGDERLPNEAVHLASGMLMAGYSSVIATMWSVRDQDAPFVADRVYGKLMKVGKLGNGEAGRALHNAVAELREEVGENAFEYWAPYIHIGL
ncbi:hypothetical protein FRC11_010405 [Ceratobasidium sp. 423]|nr:hypothetical protein FRC11_010405 [Ceratobasidium sp. 423]